eukprot:4289376-Amphidinium_carterae.1
MATALAVEDPLLVSDSAPESCSRLAWSAVQRKQEGHATLQASERSASQMQRDLHEPPIIGRSARALTRSAHGSDPKTP